MQEQYRTVSKPRSDSKQEPCQKCGFSGSQGIHQGYDDTSLMDIVILLGALLAAVRSKRLAWQWQASAASLAGGLAMGYGARIAFGCNIGAFFSGVASLSLHGWLWIASALAGTWVGIRLRPKFGLVN